ncbi:hypothetical protein F5887DRAFT_985408 [Amanita rubescens]|nr:hypothetical protein F5887DRAFT_985408 [Amanita rubescens]
MRFVHFSLTMLAPHVNAGTPLKPHPVYPSIFGLFCPTPETGLTATRWSTNSAGVSLVRVVFRGSYRLGCKCRRDVLNHRHRGHTSLRRHSSLLSAF